MRKLLLLSVPFLMLAVAAPASSQGVQTPGAANATPPAGTGSQTYRRTTRAGPAHHRARAPRRAATSERPAGQVVGEPASR